MLHLAKLELKVVTRLLDNFEPPVLSEEGQGKKRKRDKRIQQKKVNEQLYKEGWRLAKEIYSEIKDFRREWLPEMSKRLKAKGLLETKKVEAIDAYGRKSHPKATRLSPSRVALRSLLLFFADKNDTKFFYSDYYRRTRSFVYPEYIHFYKTLTGGERSKILTTIEPINGEMVAVWYPYLFKLYLIDKRKFDNIVSDVNYVFQKAGIPTAEHVRDSFLKIELLVFASLLTKLIEFSDKEHQDKSSVKIKEEIESSLLARLGNITIGFIYPERVNKDRRMFSTISELLRQIAKDDPELRTRLGQYASKRLKQKEGGKDKK
ncbi:hypothetical protein HYY74_01125 [Candidatus Woesearchaeota archaeon]|nr:hypothetical protein [Candidatus Woesearchaeota archaeon]